MSKLKADTLDSLTKTKNIPPAELYDEDDGVTKCFLCGNPNYKSFIKVEQYGFPVVYMRCGCGIIKQIPMPNEKFFDWFFNSESFFSSQKNQGNKIWGYHDYFADEANRLATSRWRYRRLSKYLDADNPLQIMKIGPSTGTFLHVAKQHGHNVLGCDVSDRFRTVAKETYGVDVDLGRFEKQGYKDEQFDIVLLLSVLENVPNQQDFLSAIQRTVKIGGYFIFNYVEMKNNIIAGLQKEKYSLYRPPIVYMYDHKVISRLLEKYGFEKRENIADMRVMNFEKIITLFGWQWLWRVVKALHIHRISFPVYAYPSRIIVAQRMR